jgi:hypothetical protein
LKIVEPTEIQQKHLRYLANTTDLVDLPKQAKEKQLLLDCSFTINRYNFTFGTSAYSGSYRELDIRF